nr:hypothetical protein GCM10017583_02030 [Agromyces mediolanus]
MGEHVLLEGSDDGVVALDDRVLDRRDLGRRRGELAALGDPEVAAAVEQSHVLVPEEGEHPERVGGPPVVLVAVDDDGRVAGDALRAQQGGELLAVEVVADDGVVELRVPVDLHRTGDVAGLVEQYVLVRLDHHETGFAQSFGEPLGGDEPLRVGVLGELLGGIERDGHAGLLRAPGRAWGSGSGLGWWRNPTRIYAARRSKSQGPSSDATRETPEHDHG